MRLSPKYLLAALLLVAVPLVFRPVLAQDTAQGSPVPIPFDPTHATPGTGAQTQAPSQGASAETLRRAYRLLSGYHGIPPQKVLSAQFSDPRAVLLLLASDAQTPPLQRQRALEALGYFADAQVEATYVKLLKDEQAPEMARHRVMTLLAQHFPASALLHVQPFLEHEDLQFRLSAIEALRRIPGDDALRALRKAAQAEPDETAQKRLRAYTRQVQ